MISHCDHVVVLKNIALNPRDLLLEPALQMFSMVSNIGTMIGEAYQKYVPQNAQTSTKGGLNCNLGNDQINTFFLFPIPLMSIIRTMMLALLTTAMAWPGCLLKTRSVWQANSLRWQRTAQQQCNSTTAHQFNSTTQKHNISTAQQHTDTSKLTEMAAQQQCNSTTAQQSNGTPIQKAQHRSRAAQHFKSTTFQQHTDTATQYSALQWDGFKA